MYLWQADYTSAYPNAPNKVKILMEQPDRYKVPSLDDYTASEGTVSIPNPNGPVFEVVAYVPNGGEIRKIADDPSTLDNMISMIERLIRRSSILSQFWTRAYVPSANP